MQGRSVIHRGQMLRDATYRTSLTESGSQKQRGGGGGRGEGPGEPGGGRDVSVCGLLSPQHPQLTALGRTLSLLWGQRSRESSRPHGDTPPGDSPLCLPGTQPESVRPVPCLVSFRGTSRPSTGVSEPRAAA